MNTYVLQNFNRRLLGFVLTLACAVFTAIAFAIPAHAQTGWLEKELVSASGGTMQPAVAMLQDGGSLTIWLQSDGLGNGLYENYRQPGENFDENKSKPLPGTPGKSVKDVRLTAISNDAFALWIESDKDYNQLRAGIRSQDGSWAKENLWATVEDIVNPQIATNEKGDQIVAWQTEEGGQQVIMAAFRPAGGIFGNPKTIAKTQSGVSSSMEELKVALDGEGLPYAAWFQRDNDINAKAAYVARGSGVGTFGTVSPALKSSSNILGDSLALAVNTRKEDQQEDEIAGHQVLIAAPSSRPGQNVVQAVQLNSESRWEAVNIKSAINTSFSNVQAVMNDDGKATVGWLSSNDQIEVSSQDENGVFNDFQSWDGNAETLNLASNSVGDTIATWSNSESQIVSAARTGKGQFSANTQIVTGNATQAAVSLDPSGNATAVSKNTSGAIQASGYVATPPISAVSWPQPGQAGENRNFSVTVESIWPVTTQWDFGDGSSSAGTLVAHAYLNGGVFVPKLTVSDGVNEIIQSSSLTIAPGVAQITLAPAQKTTSTSAAFQFSVQGASAFRCKLNDNPWTDCSSGKLSSSSQKYDHLAIGTHTFSVQATAGDGIWGPVAEYKWEVESPKPDNNRNDDRNQSLAVEITKGGAAGLLTRKIKFNRKGKGKISVACERKTKGCKGTVNLKLSPKGKKRTSIKVALIRFNVASGSTKTFRFKVSNAAKRILKKGKSAKGTATVTSENGASARSITAPVRFSMAKQRR